MRRLLLVFALVALAVTPTAALDGAPLVASGHVQDIGWMAPVIEPGTVGTTTTARLEAVRINVEDAAGIEYRAHVQNIGWQTWVRDGQVAGTTGRALRMEAVQVRLHGPYAAGRTVECRARVGGVWGPWVASGETCGTTGRALRMEAVQVRVIDSTPPAPTAAPIGPDVILVAGDLGPVGHEAVWANMSRIGATPAAGVVLTGDLGHGATAQPFCDELNSRIHAPLVWVQGNHEGRDNDGAVTADYAACLPGIGAGPEGVEQVADLGQWTRIITASPQQGIDYTPGTPGYARIAAAIDGAKAAGRWPILVMHEPHYTVGMHGPAGESSRALSYLARDKGVRLVLSGHDHNYSRIQANGVTYIVAGLGGRNLRALNPTAKHWPIVASAWDGPVVGPGYLRLEITETTITGTLVGAVGDTFTITAETLPGA